MKATTTIFVCLLAAGLASAQTLNPQIIQNTRNTMNAVHENQAAQSNAALGIESSPSVAQTPHAASTSAGSPKASSMSVSKAPIAKPVHSGPAHKHIKGMVAVPVAVPVAAPAPPAAAPAEETSSNASAPASPAEEGGSQAEDQGSTDSKWNANGKRDPFVSPVVSHNSASGCSTGKKCLEIGTINLRGVVHSESGFIAVVSNSLNKAYFLRENDPVFDGYVIRITGDSIVFQETLQDRLGKTFTREVVKKITAPVV